MLLLAHDIPGRLRLAAPRLKGDRRAAAAMRTRLRAVPGVTEARVNLLTGSVVVHYDGRAETRAQILGGLDLRAGGTPARLTPALAERIAERAADALAERLVERAMRVALAALI